LTEKQIAPVDSINLLYAKAQVALRENASGDREKIREAMVALATKKEEALVAVLTKEQMDLYKKRMSERGNFTRRNNQR
jgi:predicted methyltransferase